MSFTIQTNTSANNVLFSMQNNLQSLNNYSQQLSTGYKINSAADDAAGLSIATKMGNQITGLNQATQNAQDGVSMLQTLGGALSSITDMLGRMRQLSIQAANGTATQSDRSQIATELKQIRSEISRTASTTQFNTQGLLTGLATKGIKFQVGANENQMITFAVTKGTMNATGLSITATMVNNLATGSTGAQISAAQKLMSQVDKALSTVSSFQANVGATEDRLNFAISNLGTASNNLASAKANIMDTNMAQAMTDYSRQNILVQAGVSMLSQAQQTPSMVLKLLQ